MLAYRDANELVASRTLALVAGIQRSGSLIKRDHDICCEVRSMPRRGWMNSYCTLLFDYHGYAFGGLRGTREA